jgi:hypothetical protein
VYECAECGSPFAADTPTLSNKKLDSHACGICAFLFQANSQPIEVASALQWHPLVVAGCDHLRPIHLPIYFGLHAPRGPPILGWPPLMTVVE